MSGFTFRNILDFESERLLAHRPTSQLFVSEDGLCSMELVNNFGKPKINHNIAGKIYRTIILSVALRALNMVPQCKRGSCCRWVMFRKDVLKNEGEGVRKTSLRGSSYFLLCTKYYYDN
jgi:hypothetical protein